MSTTAGALQRLLSLAEEDLWTDFQRASEFMQRGNIGSGREKTLKKFLEERLPERYHVDSGEAVDSLGNHSTQQDLMIYDGSLTRPLMGLKDDNVLLPAEALLATIEVKSKITDEETGRSIDGIRSIHSLQPWCNPWIAPRKGGETAEDGQPRILTSIFAYETDLGNKNWPEKEINRIREKATRKAMPVEYLNRVVVLGNGLLIPSDGQAAEPGQASGVLGPWFFSLVNFLAREVERRKPFPWGYYETKRKQVWRSVAPPKYDAPSTGPSTRREIKKKLKAPRIPR